MSEVSPVSKEKEGLEHVKAAGTDFTKGAVGTRKGRSRRKDKPLDIELRMSWPPYFDSVCHV